jgi:hypothetical protein
MSLTATATTNCIRSKQATFCNSVNTFTLGGEGVGAADSNVLFTQLSRNRGILSET